MGPSEPRGWRAVVPALCAVFFALHADNHRRLGHGWDAFWACHWATLMIGAAALTRGARLNSIGLVWLALGNALWLTDLACGGEWMWTSALTHWASLALGLAQARWLGYAPGSWWRAHLALVGWQQLTRLFTPPDRNINMAFAIHPTSRGHFSSYPLYWLFMLGLCALIMGAGEALYRRLLPPRRP